jgi:hypothetical protein
MTGWQLRWSQHGSAALRHAVENEQRLFWPDIWSTMLPEPPPSPSERVGRSSSSRRRLGGLLANVGRIRLSTWLALVGAGLSLLLALWNVPSRDPGIVFGGVLALVVPYLAIAVALSGRSVWSKALGVAVAALMAWLMSFGPAEVVGNLARGHRPRGSAVTSLLLTIVSLGISGFGLRDLIRTAHRTGYWARTPTAARLALLTLAFWTLTFMADSYVSGNLPLLRMLMAPLLMIASLAAALMLRAWKRPARVTGLLVTAVAAMATLLYWITYSRYLTLGGGQPTVPYVAYYTLLPWPALLSVSLVLHLATLAAGTRELLRGGGRALSPPD